MPELAPPVLPDGHLRALAQPRLEAGRLILRPWQAADVSALVRAYAAPDIQGWHVRSMTAAEAADWISSRRDRWEAETGADWAVTGDDVVLGRVGLRTLSLGDGSAEIAFWTLPEARGQAVAARGVQRLTTWLFASVGLQRIELRHSVANHASCRVADTSGFVHEGTLRRQGWHADGWHDMHLHARTRPE